MMNWIGMKFSPKLNFFRKKNKILFGCNFCGDCCKGMDIPLTYFDINRILLLDNIPNPDYFITLYPSDKNNLDSLLLYGDYHNLYLSTSLSENNCIFLKDNKCTIYENRPLPCRTWPFTLNKEQKLEIGKTAYEMTESLCDKKEFKDVEEMSKIIKKSIEETDLDRILIKKWNKEVENDLSKQTFEYFISFICDK